jgi:hypothetical protein
MFARGRPRIVFTAIPNLVKHFWHILLNEDEPLTLRASVPIGIALTLAARGVAAQADAPTPLSEVVVTASRVDLLGKALAASSGVITREELTLRPAYRVGQLLESVPGLVVTAHSGEGKANQYLARGFNLDHGTDIANFIDDIPINRSTNAHGQGYSDINFIIPDTLEGIAFTKGPYHPEIGDFGAVVSEHMRLADVLPNTFSISAGTLGDDRTYLGGARALDADHRVAAALDASKVDGPFEPPNAFKAWRALARLSEGSPENGYDVTFMYYKGEGFFTTDQPVRAVGEGLISRYGTLDPTDGNRSERLSLSAHDVVSGGDWRFAASAYYVRSRMTLWNNFTHFLEDPVRGDQEQQDETRDLAGGTLIFISQRRLLGLPSDTTVGVQGRYDGVYVDRRHTQNRTVLDYCTLLYPDGSVTQYSIGESACTANLVTLGDLGLYIANTTHWRPWLRTEVGVREEIYWGRDRSLLPGSVFFDHAYHQTATLLQPKGTIVIGPLAQTEIYVSAGRGFHSDDIRGVSGTAPLEGIPATAGPTPLIVKADGEEVGVRTNIVPRLQIQLAAFNIHLASELVYDQDQGEDQAGPPSERDGFELSAEYHPVRWLELNTDLSFSHARYVDVSYDVLLNDYGFNGYYIPNAPHFIGSVGALVDNLGPWYGGLQVRLLGAYPLLPDNSRTDAGYSATNVTVGYKINRQLRAQLEIFNLFDVKANGGAYAYTTVIPDGRGPVLDHQFHPIEPISARFTLTARF